MTARTRSCFVALIVLAASTTAAGESSVDGKASSGLELLDCVLPLERQTDPQATWTASARVIPAFDVEWTMVVTRKSSGSVTAVLRYAASDRIVDQYARLEEMSKGTVPCEFARTQLQVRSTAVESDREPALLRLTQQFERLEWRVRLSPEFTFDATRYELLIDGTQDQARLLIHEPPWTPKRMGGHVLADWIEQVRLTVLKSKAANKLRP